MRKVFFLFALMMTLLPLSGCFRGGEGQKALDAALTIRGEYLALTNFSSQVQLRADYGLRVYDYVLDVNSDAEEMILSVAAPELIAGITARLKAEESFLEFDGLSVETGPLNEQGLTPLSAVPALLDAVRGAYITACCFEDSGLLRVDCGDPDTPLGSGTEYILWFHPDTHDLTRGEISVDGRRRIECTFSPFTKE